MADIHGTCVMHARHACCIQDGNARLFHFLAWIPHDAINDSWMILDGLWVIHW